MGKEQHILFIHIPKTAGTSFRVAAEEYYDKDNIFYDYSPHFKETSKCVLEMIYKEQDYYKFYHHISKLEKSFFTGHFNVNKYGSLYETLNVISFVRNPIDQVLSHFNHYKNLHNYKKDFIDFIKEERFRNVQSKTLKNKPIGLYGFLGVTEEYTESVEIFNALYDTKLSFKHINVKRKNSLNLEDIDDKIIDVIKKLNEDDNKLYKAVRVQLEVRKELHAKELPFTYGFIQKKTEKEIAGIAFQNNSDEPVEIDIYLGDTYMETVFAKNLRPGQTNTPRKKFIGFDYICKDENETEHKLCAFVKETGQEIV